MSDIHPDLAGAVRASRLILAAFLVAAAVSIVLAFALKVNAPLILGQPLVRLVLLFDAVVTAGLGWALAGGATAYYRRATALLAGGIPRRLRIAVHYVSGKGEGSGAWVADLRPSDTDTPRSSYHLVKPAWDIKTLADNTEVDVLSDRAPGSPIVIRTPHGLLWSAATIGNRLRSLPSQAGAL